MRCRWCDDGGPERGRVCATLARGHPYRSRFRYDPQAHPKMRSFLGGTDHGRWRELVLSEKTVKTHMSAILGKLNVADRTQAALVAVRDGLVGPPSW